MERAPQGEIRTPTSHWAGLNLSKTSPYALESVSDQSAAGNGANTSSNSSVNPPGISSTTLSQWSRSDNASPYNLNATTGMLDVLPAQQRALLCQHKDIHSLLMHLGLEHYISKY